MSLLQAILQYEGSASNQGPFLSINDLSMTQWTPQIIQAGPSVTAQG